MDPAALLGAGGVFKASPHTRGWTRIVLEQPDRVEGFPAHAGMDPGSTSSRSLSTRLPRTRGDGPWLVQCVCSLRSASPHTRGWTLALDAEVPRESGFPAHTLVQPGSCRQCPLIHPLHVVIAVLSRMTPFPATVDTRSCAGAGSTCPRRRERCRRPTCEPPSSRGSAVTRRSGCRSGWKRGGRRPASRCPPSSSRTSRNGGGAVTEPEPSA